VRLAVLLVAAFVIGAAAGWRSDRSLSPAPAGSPPPSAAAPFRGATADRAACALAVVDVLADIERMNSEAYGDPEPFPDDLDPAYLPAAVEERARRVPLECPELGMDLARVDCTEFPCFTVWTSRTQIEDMKGPAGCPAWDATPRDDGHTLATNTWVGADGELLRVVLLGTYPPGWNAAHGGESLPREQRWTRFDLRRTEIWADLQAETGARDLTKVESAERSLESLRAQFGDDHEAVRFAEEALERARASGAAAAK
jgi:hypothetical protein